MYKSLLLLIFIFLLARSLSAQNNFTLLVQPGVELSYNVTEHYSQRFGVESRNYVFEDGKWDFGARHLELSHLSGYVVKKNQNLGLGVLYRFRDNFSGSKENELRLQQQFVLKQNKKGFDLKHQFRNEQRIHASTTKFRFRYKLSFDFDLGESLGAKTSFEASTESLLEVAHTQKPEWGQRANAVFAWEVSKTAELEIGPQYRLEEYNTHDLSHELYLLAGLSIDL